MLVPELIKNGFDVTVADLLIYGNNINIKSEKLNIINIDIRNLNALEKIIPNHDTVIHLACISNDPSFELNPNLGKSINYDCFEPMVKICKENGVKRFIFASSSSVYGIKKEVNVNENMSLKPLTDYSRYKAECEDILIKYNDKEFNTTIVRPCNSM